jgi:hypothetical protein
MATAIITFVFAALLVFAINAFVIAPYRAFRMMHPFSVKIISGALETQYPISSVESQKIAVVIKNNAYKAFVECVLHITNIGNFDDKYSALPRFVEEFSVQPGVTKTVMVFSWTPRETKMPITACGPVGWGWGGNIVMLPCDQCYDVTIRIGIPKGDTINISCRVWIEGGSFKAVQI